MLRQVARELQQFLTQRRGPADFGIVGIQPRLADVLIGGHVAPTAPDGARQGGGDVFSEAQRLAHLADGHARAVVDDRGDNGGALAGVAAIDVLHHLLPALMFEIDIDVGGLAALLRNEAGEQQLLVVLGGIHRRDPQAEADTGIGRRSPPLAEDVLAAGPGDDVVDGEEVVGEAQLLDQVELVLDGRALLVSHARREPPLSPRPG